MGDSVRRDDNDPLLSLLKPIWKLWNLFSRKGFSAFSLLFLTTSGAFPALPALDTKEIAHQDAEEPIVADQPVDANELCRWRQDFFFFDKLFKDKTTGEDNTPCVVPTQVSDTETHKASQHDESLATLIGQMTAGYPLSDMSQSIAEYDRDVAALIVGIGKKESDWGKHVPRTPDGVDCFNYWGFKGAGSRGIAMGHGCFGSPEEAVHAVGNRLTELVQLRKTSDPKNMIIWKCGSSCATHSPESVEKWIADVDFYYRKIAQN